MKNKLKLIPSSDKTEKSCQWNRFDPETVTEFFKKYAHVVKFVDFPQMDFWTNCDDTIVFVINVSDFGYMGVFRLAAHIHRNLRADEADAVEISSSKLLIRLWWD